MNKLRRKNLATIIARLEEVKADFEELISEEEDYLDAFPENLQGSERYERAEEGLSYLNDAYDYFDEVIDNINSAIEA